MNTAQRGSIAVLILRLVTGIAFLFHGWSKITNPLHWMDMMPGHPPGFLQALAALAEFGGGVGLLLGLLTPLCCAGLIATMLVAIYTHVSHGDPFVSKGGGAYELATVYLAIAITLLLLGPGRYSLDQKLLGKAARSDY
jgi:putative oxidoreductase